MVVVGDIDSWIEYIFGPKLAGSELEMVKMGTVGFYYIFN